VTFSSKDKIAVLVAIGLGAVFAYLTMLAGPAWTLVEGAYGIAIIPLTIVYIADQRKLLVWQATIIPFAAYVVVANAHLGGLRPAEGVTVFLGFWAGGTVISSPVPAYYYVQRAKKRKYYRIELFFVGLAFFILLCSLWSDPFITFAVAMIWIVVWLAKCVWDWRFGPDQPDPKKAAIVAASVLILASSIPALAAAFFKQRTFGLAMRKDHLEVAGWLVGIGADPNALNVYGQTALREAAWDGNIKAVSALLSMGVKPDLEGKAEFQGLMPSGTALTVAAAEGRAEICSSLLDAGADPNKMNRYGTTPLLAALSHGSPSCAPALLEHGAGVNTRNASGETALMLITQFDVDRDPFTRRVLDQLLARGADVLAKDDKGQTAEDWALLYHREQLAVRLRDIEKSIEKTP
jgi:ankyrin repeat protein